ncbi:SpoIIE family protein phosphatase [Kineococcus sp. GCM10028916]|uniref:SpoIIE family protein phosphatase n=1 Tax=Kineococcus sp. GCM10028916 TaxID=3273394 RepID=UPI00362ECB95
MADAVRDFAALFDGLPAAFLVMDRELVIVEANHAYCRLLGRDRNQLIGRHVFDAFPPTPESLSEDGGNPLETAFLRARDEGSTESLPLFTYDVRDPTTGELVQRWWSLVCAPLPGADGSTDHVLQRIEDVTDYVRNREDDRSHTRDVEAELFVRLREVESARAAERSAAQRVSALGGAALRLAQAQHQEVLIEVVAGLGLEAVGAASVEIALVPLLDPDGPLDLWQVTNTAERRVTTRGELARDQVSHLATALRTGLRSIEPECIVVPLSAGDGPLGALAFCWPETRAIPDVDVDLVETIAVQYGQAVARLRARETEQAVAADAVSMSEALQRSLLTEPRQPEDVLVVARYRPAAQRAQIGGDWYDSFRTADGRTTLVVGDVSGHDEESAAVMGQVRNLLRGIAYCSAAGPATVLTRLDHALVDLDVGGLATSVLLTLQEGPGEGERTMHWSNAGAPPPLLRSPDGSATLLQPEPELLLGLDPETGRSDHRLVLPLGAGVLLFTDGLVERRDADIEDGLEWLRHTVSGMPHHSLAEICDELLRMVEGYAEDDVVLLGVQVLAPADIDLRSVAVPGATARPRRG